MGLLCFIFHSLFWKLFFIFLHYCKLTSIYLAKNHPLSKSNHFSNLLFIFRYFFLHKNVAQCFYPKGGSIFWNQFEASFLKTFIRGQITVRFSPSLFINNFKYKMLLVDKKIDCMEKLIIQIPYNSILFMAMINHKS